MTILIAQVLRVLLALTSSAPANDHAIPSHTTASTPRSNTIFTTNRISLANTTWKPTIPLPVVHLYFRVVIFPQASSHIHGVGGHIQSAPVSPHAQAATQTQVAPGIFSDTIVVIVLDSSAAFQVLTILTWIFVNWKL